MVYSLVYEVKEIFLLLHGKPNRFFCMGAKIRDPGEYAGGHQHDVIY